MGRIKGHYEWDDDELAPGHKKEGGLHQNLFDIDGKLRGSARFVPDEGGDPEPLIVTETVYIPVEERRLSREEEELQQAIAALVGQLIDVGIAKGKPLAEQWWRETARPAIAAKRAALDERRSRRKERKRATAIGGIVFQPSREVDEASTANRPSMSSAEAQARTLAALAARAYSDEQMRLVTSSNIVDGEGLAEPQDLLAELPSDQVRSLIEEMVRNPVMLGDDTLADLASILGRSALKSQDLVRRAVN